MDALTAAAGFSGTFSTTEQLDEDGLSATSLLLVERMLTECSSLHDRTSVGEAEGLNDGLTTENFAAFMADAISVIGRLRTAPGSSASKSLEAAVLVDAPEGDDGLILRRLPSGQLHLLHIGTSSSPSAVFRVCAVRSRHLVHGWNHPFTGMFVPGR